MAKSKKKKISQPKDWMIWPVSAALLIVPLVMCYYPIPADIDTFRLIGLEWNVDFFSQGKAVVLYAICLFSAVFACMEWHRFPKVLRDDRLKKYGILCGVFIVFTLLSSLFSKHPGVSFFGFYDRAEGFFTQLCYLYIMFFAAVAWISDCDIRWVTIPLMALLVIELTLCVSQYFGHDLVLSGFAQRLMGVPNGGASSTFGAGIVYGTMYHYNHLGSFVGMILPVFAILSINGTEKTSWRIVYAACTALSVALLLLCSARGAYIGIACSALLGLILCAKCIGGFIMRHKVLSLATLGIVVLGLVLGLGTMPDRTRSRVFAMLGDVKSLFSETEDPKSTWPVTDLWNLDDGTVKIDFPQGSLIVSISDTNELVLTDENGAAVACRVEAATDGKRLIPEDARFASANFKEYDARQGEFVLSAGDWNEIVFICKDGESGAYISEYYSNDKMEIDYPDVMGYLIGREKIGSMRGYIWGRTFPMLKQHILLGSGPDTFVYEFPNRDLLAKRYAYETVYTYVDKAHSQFLQVFIQNGGIAFLAYLGILLLYLIDSIKLYGMKRTYSAREWFGLALCLAVVGYMGDTFFIDSCISVAPIFWALLGVGIAVNRANRKAQSEIAAGTTAK